jgi:hypothetical protein
VDGILATALNVETSVDQILASVCADVKASQLPMPAEIGTHLSIVRTFSHNSKRALNFRSWLVEYAALNETHSRRANNELPFTGEPIYSSLQSSSTHYQQAFAI